MRPARQNAADRNCGKNGADIDCIKRLVGADEPLVIYDNDKVNPATGLPGGYELVEAVAARMYCQAATTSTKNLDDYVKANKNLMPASLYGDVFSRIRKVPLRMETVRAVVEEYLSAGDIEGNAREIAVTDVIVRDLKRRAQLFNVDGYALLLFPDGETTTDQVPVRKGNPRFHDLMRQYGISRPDWVDACGKAINIEATRRDTPRRTLHSTAAWTGSKLYINCYEGSMVRISVANDKPEVQRIPSGADGILMQRYAHSLEDNEAQMSDAAKGESDRGLALFCATTLDELLKQCIETHLVDHKEVRKLTDGPIAPIGTFAGRILLAFAVGLISTDEYDNLTLIRKIRNEFAHSIDVSFRTASVVSHCASLRQLLSIRDKDAIGAREMFSFSAIFMVVLLESRITEAREQRLFHQEWKPPSGSSQSV